MYLQSWTSNSQCWASVWWLYSICNIQCLFLHQENNIKCHFTTLHFVLLYYWESVLRNATVSKSSFKSFVSISIHASGIFWNQQFYRSCSWHSLHVPLKSPLKFLDPHQNWMFPPHSIHLICNPPTKLKTQPKTTSMAEDFANKIIQVGPDNSWWYNKKLFTTSAYSRILNIMGVNGQKKDTLCILS